MNTKSTSGLKVKAGIKAGGLPAANHSRSGLKVKTSIKAGSGIDPQPNHNRRLLSVG